MVRVSKKGFPVKRIINVYNVIKHLPDNSSFFHVFVIGNLSPGFLNLLKQHRDWYRDAWINVEDDMNLRNYILQVYSDEGRMFPRMNIYYSFIDENSLIIALKINEGIRGNYDVESYKYLRVYSNQYFNTLAFNALSDRTGIQCRLFLTDNNSQKVQVQNHVTSLKSNGGDVFIYVNGYHTDNVNLNIPNGSFIEVLYDRSVISKESFTIGDLRTFDSTKDNKLKYLLHRDKLIDYIQYQDDNELYISTQGQLVNKGLFFYEHKGYAVRNVTDKDYALYTSFVNSQANRISELEGGAIQDKSIILYTRKSGKSKPLVYSSLKLHELYQLPKSAQLDVLLNSSYTITDFRAETLENSDYFKLASAEKLNLVTKELSTSTVGYNGIKFYNAYTPTKISDTLTIDVPYLFRDSAYAYEYSNTGKLINRVESHGPLYTCSSVDVKHVEFLKGITPATYDRLYLHNEIITLRNSEYRILSAYFDGTNRISNWEDITDTPKAIVSNDTVAITEEPGKKIKVFYFDQPLTYSLSLPIVDGVLYFPLTVEEDRGTGLQQFPLDFPYLNAEIFINGYRLTHGIGYFIKFPYISICDKTHIDYTKTHQDIHIRLHGYNLNKDLINSNEINGFIHHGALTRNNRYDIRDDRVFSVYIKGRLQDRTQVIFSEKDNVVRTVNPLNGLPYSVVEHMVSVQEVCGESTLPLYEENININNRISDLYDIIYKEPVIQPMNTISDQYYLFSPLVGKVIHDILDANISPTIYTTRYNDTTILTLIEERYKILYELDPIRHNLPMSIVEIHPDIGNTVITVSLHAYRFLTNLIRIITNGKPELINLSGYLNVTAENTIVSDSGSFTPTGVVVL
jgi:hypothetical protein